VNRDRRDRVLDWHEELQRLEPDLPKLPGSARLAVETTVEHFLREDAEAGVELGAASARPLVHALHDAA
jgi:hypothetical protein